MEEFVPDWVDRQMVCYNLVITPFGYNLETISSIRPWNGSKQCSYLGSYSFLVAVDYDNLFSFIYFIFSKPYMLRGGAGFATVCTGF